MNRNYYLDNCKAFLIILVVTTHFLGGLAGDSGIIKTYTIFTNMFYMPAFIMISGYFSKHTELTKLVKTILVPYVFFQILNFVVDYFILKQEVGFSLVIPAFTLWYLLSLFFWRIIAEHFVKIKYPIFVAVMISLLAGMDSNIGGSLSLSRTIYFFPFFIWGYLYDKKHSIKIVLGGAVRKVISLICLICVLVVIYMTNDRYSEFYFRGSTSYEGLGQSVLCGVVFRFICYLLAVFITLCIAVWVPNQRIELSVIGSRTMSIYMWHGVIYRIIRYATPTYTFFEDNGIIGRIVCGLLALGIVGLLSTKPIVFVTNKISEMPVERLLKV